VLNNPLLLLSMYTDLPRIFSSTIFPITLFFSAGSTRLYAPTDYASYCFLVFFPLYDHIQHTYAYTKFHTLHAFIMYYSYVTCSHTILIPRRVKRRDFPSTKKAFLSGRLGLRARDSSRLPETLLDVDRTFNSNIEYTSFLEAVWL
jgi:hypothetical protein